MPENLIKDNFGNCVHKLFNYAHPQRIGSKRIELNRIEWNRIESVRTQLN